MGGIVRYAIRLIFPVIAPIGQHVRNDVVFCCCGQVVDLPLHYIEIFHDQRVVAVKLVVDKRKITLALPPHSGGVQNPPLKLRLREQYSSPGRSATVHRECPASEICFLCCRIQGFCIFCQVIIGE